MATSHFSRYLRTIGLLGAKAGSIAFIVDKLLLAYTPSQPQDHTSSPSEDGQSSAPSPTQSSRDPFYSNQDIAILYDIVVAAQERLDQNPNSSSLPAASLFKAYDVVLPRYGIDPDDDHHLSTFIFRIGGERGDGTLVDKFQAILGRMGIVLEHGDDTTVSPRASLSASGSHVATHPTSGRPFNPAAEANDALSENGRSPPALPSNSHANAYQDVAYPSMKDAKQPSHSFMDYVWDGYADGQLEPHPDNDEARNHAPFQSSPRVSSVDGDQPSGPIAPIGSSMEPLEQQQQLQQQPNSAANAMRRAALVAALDRWRGITSKQSRQPSGSNVPNHHPAASTEGLSWQSGVSNNLHHANHAPESNEQENIEGSNAPSATYDLDKTGMRQRQKQAYLPTIVEATFSTTVPLLPSNDKNDHIQEQQTGTLTLQVNHARLLTRAARAREIYLASKVFNHWANRTSRRLEREAVARRHMIRFRCFRGWSHVPSARMPDTEHMKSVTAMQKLRRAVTQQEEQFEKAAMAIANAHRAETVSRVCGLWLSHVKGHSGLQKTLARAKAKTLTKWTAQASTSTDLNETIRKDKMFRDGIDALRNWQSETDRYAIQSSIAQGIDYSRLAYTYLGEWWQQAEAKRRAETWRYNQLMNKAALVFEQWNVRARAQAFLWRNEYLSVSRCFEKWDARTKELESQENRAVSIRNSACVAKLTRYLNRTVQQRSVLSQMHGRARFYIGTMRGLDVLEGAVKRRRNREREHVRRYLMMRYTQVSSQRKRRNFFQALDRWRTQTRQAAEEAQLIELSLEAESTYQKKLALTNWRGQVNMGLQLQNISDVHFASKWFTAWEQLSSRLEAFDMEAWDTWVSKKQRQCTKEWSIATMQGGGQAHTAKVVRQKHEKEKRGQAFKQWKQLAKGKRSARHISTLRLTPPPARGLSNSWRGSLMARSLARRTPQQFEPIASLIGTPTRSTGLPLAVDSTSDKWNIPPLLEENADAPPESESNEGINATAYPISENEANFHVNLPSTTPRAPVPTHLQRETYSLLLESERRGRTGPKLSHSAISRLPVGVSIRSSLAPLRQSAIGRLGIQSSLQGSTPALSKTQPLGRQVATSELFASAIKGQSDETGQTHVQNVTPKFPASMAAGTTDYQSSWRADEPGQLPSELSSDGRTIGARRNA